jgi:hypothetical protein
MTDKVPILVVLGIDVDGKPHGSRFEERDAPFVERAAELMGFHVVRIAADNAELHAIAEGLPLGKIFATGRAFVPYVARSAFDKLAALVEGDITARAPRPLDAERVRRLIVGRRRDRLARRIRDAVVHSRGRLHGAGDLTVRL